jgi:2-octaprenyl-6-methoxyphenol hydroxylase
MVDTTTGIAVIGAGPAGLAAACALAARDVEVMLLGPAFDPAAGDQRTTALLSSSITLLKNIGAWADLASDSATLKGIRIIDDRGGLMRAPEVLFEARELALDGFGANIANPQLNAALHGAAGRLAHVRRIATAAVTAVDPGADGVRLTLAEGSTLTAKLVVAADGRNSLSRAAAAIPVRRWAYPQIAIVCSFRHRRPHDGVTMEFHRPSGPLTTVPMPGSASALVWVDVPERARAVALLDDGAFCTALEQEMQACLGAVRAVGPRVLHPLSGLLAASMGQNRVALVGEAAHVIPPIGAQGLNLSLRDTATLADCVADALAKGADPGAPELLLSYDRARRPDVATRTLAVDLLNRSLLVDILPVQALRGAGLHLLANIGAVRRLAMQAGLEPPTALPRLMRTGPPSGP